MRLQEASDEFVDYVMDRPAIFGGTYFDQSLGRLEATVLTTSSTPTRDVERVKALVPAGLSTRFVESKSSLQELLTAQAALVDQRDTLGLRMAWPDFKTGRLSLVLAPGSDAEALDRIVAIPVDVTFGDGLRLAACSGWNTCTPYRGGIHIWYPAFPIHCSWGYYGTRGAAAKFIITAGHCGRRGFALKTSPANVTFTDLADRNQFDEVTASNSDSMTARVLGSPNAVAPFNRIIASSSDFSHTISAVKSNGSQVPGTAVCFFGIATHPASPCGTIEATGISATIVRDDGQDLLLVNQVQMSKVGAAGDSGGPVYQGSTAFGIVSAVNASNLHVVYSRIGNVSTDMAISVCVTSAC
jgi:hypothetical protein